MTRTADDVIAEIDEESARERMAELESVVVEAAIVYKKAQDDYMGGGSMWGFSIIVEPRLVLDNAIDALLAAREEKK